METQQPLTEWSRWLRLFLHTAYCVMCVCVFVFMSLHVRKFAFLYKMRDFIGGKKRNIFIRTDLHCCCSVCQENYILLNIPEF